jgi:riboflavin biosynthesis pyrimidine reductase
VSVGGQSVAIAPLETLIIKKRGKALPLPSHLARLYGDLYLPPVHRRPQVLSNFVTTLDGVVSLNAKGHAGGADISGFSAQDRMVMGLLRAVSDVIIVGSGTLEADPQHVWTPEAICPEFALDYRHLRQALGKREAPLNVIVSGSGRLDLRLPVFRSGQVHALIITTTAGAKRLAQQPVPDAVQIRATHRSTHPIRASTILHEVRRARRCRRILVEGGPRLLGNFFAQRLVGEQFLTLAPQIAGRKIDDGRPSLVMGQEFARRDPLWGTLTDVRRGGSHLFLRYSFPGVSARSGGPLAADRKPTPRRVSREAITF